MAGMRKPTFTIVIPATHSLRDVQLCVESVEALEYPRDLFTTVLVDCHCLQGLQEWWETTRAGLTKNIAMIALPPLPPSRWDWINELRLNEARNAAVLATPAENYILTEDDCSFTPDWLTQIEQAIEPGAGALSGPDILPEGLGLFEDALDVLLNSPLGSPGGRRKNEGQENSYVPIKDYCVLPAAAWKIVAPLPEDCVFGAEASIAAKLRAEGLKIEYLPDVPIWHRRTTTLPRFLKRNALIAGEKVAGLFRERRFVGSAHSLLLAACAGAVATLIAAPCWRPALWLLLLGATGYVTGMLVMGGLAWHRKRRICVALLLAALVPLHHASVVLGILKGALLRERACLRSEA